MSDYRPVRVLVGGVGQLYQGDLDLGRRVVDALAGDDLGPGVAVEELHYGAVAVAQRLQELTPQVLVLVGAEPRGRQPGTVERREVAAAGVDAERAQAAVADAVTGYVAIDLILDVAAGLGALPPTTIVVEAEPADTGPGEQLSPVGQATLGELERAVRAELTLVTRPASRPGGRPPAPPGGPGA